MILNKKHMVKSGDSRSIEILKKLTRYEERKNDEHVLVNWGEEG
jgi:hypothetical protein